MISSVGDTGMVKIEWDREITLYENYPLLPEHKVATRDWSAIPDGGIEERLEFK